MSLYLTTSPDLLRFENQMSRIFDNFFSDLSTARRDRRGDNLKWVPLIDLYETEKEYVVNAELPGIPKDKVSVEVNENVLNISGKVEQDKTSKEGNTHIQECHYGSYSRSIPLPSNAKSDEIAAKYENGILEIKIPKAENVGKKISVQ
ncbi:hypothetical protein G9A89_003492 [Geosiphon pyriformis]|nr:hypothetical protein G9A89_003492 [Geosiphon pyriformis]